MTTLERREKCPRNRSGKGVFSGVEYPPNAKPAPPSATGNTED